VIHAARLGFAAALLAIAAAGCGGSSKSAAPTTTAAGAPATTTPATTTSASGPGALQAEANQTAAGDIPDNQVFLVFHDTAAGYSMKYPEGWARQGSGDNVTFRDKNNIVRVVLSNGSAPTAGSVKADLTKQASTQLRSGPAAMTISGRPAIKAVYTTESAPNEVTGKRVKLVVDRYELWKGGKVAVVDLGTPEGVDNVDAYRLMIESFRWS
jgi:hypothetical protein